MIIALMLVPACGRDMFNMIIIVVSEVGESKWCTWIGIVMNS